MHIETSNAQMGGGGAHYFGAPLELVAPELRKETKSYGISFLLQVSENTQHFIVIHCGREVMGEPDFYCLNWQFCVMVVDFPLFSRIKSFLLFEKSSSKQVLQIVS